MKLGFRVGLTGAAFLWTGFVSRNLVGSPSGAFLHPWGGGWVLRPSPCSGWRGIGRPAALIGACTCSSQPRRPLGSGAASVCLCVCAHLISSVNTETLQFSGPNMLEGIQAAWPLSSFWRGGTPLLTKKGGFLAMQVYPVHFDIISPGPKRIFPDKGRLQVAWEGATAGLPSTHKLLHFLWVSHTSATLSR